MQSSMQTEKEDADDYDDDKYEECNENNDYDEDTNVCMVYTHTFSWWNIVVILWGMTPGWHDVCLLSLLFHTSSLEALGTLFFRD